MEKRTIAERFGTGFAIELETMRKIKHHATVSELEDFIYDRLRTAINRFVCKTTLELKK